MSNDKKHVVDELAQIIQLLADVWPNDRENVAIAGAKFESVIESFDQNFGQIQKLASHAWEGIKHLYEKDEFFMEVKATTMQAINMFREFILTDGDIKPEDFDKAYTELNKALQGGKESADTVITEEELETLNAEAVDANEVEIDVATEAATIIQLLADVWPNDRQNVAIAGANFEKLVSALDSISGQLKKLVDIAYQGMMHLYEKDEYFLEVKATSMKAINLFREFVQEEGDISVEDFEKAYSELKNALEGGKESADKLITEEELESLNTIEQEQESEEIVDLAADVAEVIQLLEEISPSNKDNVALAGAKFEKVVSGQKRSSGQMQKLSDLAYQGIIHLYQKDEYFDAVKAATQQAISIYREFVLPDADVSVEDYENAYEGLKKALAGKAEISKVADIEDKVQVSGDSNLDDLSTHLMMMDESSEKEEIELLAEYLLNSASSEMNEVAAELKKAHAVVEQVLSGEAVEAGWLEKVSEYIEKAGDIANEQEWENSQVEDEAVADIAEPEQVSNPEPTISAPVINENKTESVAPEIESKDVFLIPEDIDISMVGEFITECSELIESAESALLDLEDSPDDNELVNTVFRAFHTIKGTSAFMGLDPITEFTHHVETVLSIVRDGDLPFDRACADINFESIDIIKKLLGTVENCNGGDPLPVPVNYHSMLRVLIDVAENNIPPADALAKEGEAVRPIASEEEVSPDTTGESLVDSPTSSSVKGAKSEAEAQNNSNQKNDTESSVRVSVNRLDRLIDMVGELVIAHSVVAQDPNISKDSELQKKVNHATKILRELQDTSLTLRMVPLKATFHKMNRLVRDLSRKAGKKVKFNTVGEDTEIDRNMVDIINEPLIHMLRNSLDHGIETAEQRAQTDKPDVANITLRAFQEGGKVVIQIQDDGRGINKEVILRKAIEKGLIDPDKKLTDPEIYGLIFLPGFSSAEVVTDLSGRGVGMDVVRRSIEELQGKIEVTSELGVGTTITIELPFTLAITDGMLIRVGDERFIIPTVNIDMTFRAQPDDLFTVLGENEQVSFRGKSVPVIRLHRLFDINEAIEEIMDGTLLVIKNNNDRFALLVDEVIGQQQLVGKSINMIAPTEHISGGAILGDGRVGLILDTAALIQ